MAYAVAQDVYDLGLSAQAFRAIPRPVDVANVDASTATIRLEAHGYSASDLISFRVTGGGSLPTGISAFTVYYPVVVSSDLIRITATEGGAAIASWASTGSGWSIAVDPERRLLRMLADDAAIIDNDLIAHATPIAVDPTTGRYPQILVGLNARMTARRAVTTFQIENAQYRVAVDRVMSQEQRDDAMRAEWRAGKPIWPTPTDRTTTAENGARAGSDRDSMPWTRGCL